MVSSTRSDNSFLLAALLIGLTVRGGVCFYRLPSFSADPDAYRAIAETLAEAGVYGLAGDDGAIHPTAFRPPLYPYLLSWITTDGRLTGGAVALFHTLLGAWTVAMTFLACRRLLEGQASGPTSLVAATLVAIDPILLQQSTLVMTETLATALVATLLWWWPRHCQSAAISATAAVVGALLSAAFLCRPTFLVWAVLIVAGALLARGIKTRRAVVSSLVISLLMLVTLGAWTLRNRRSVGHPVWATTHGGYTLLLGNNPSFYDHLAENRFGVAWNPESFLLAYSHRYDGDPNTDEFWRKDWPAPGKITRRVTEHEDDRVAYEAACATIARNRPAFAWSCLVRLGRLWTPFPHHTADRSWASVLAVGTYYSLFYLGMLLGIRRLGRRAFGLRWWPILSLAITLSLVHALYWSNLRMRAPVIPGLAIVVAAATTKPDKS